jgi:hypothetical protein
MSCMQYIAFDFETSGLPKGRKPVTQETLGQYDTCRAVSLSAARFSSKGRLVDTFDAMSLPRPTSRSVLGRSPSTALPRTWPGLGVVRSCPGFRRLHDIHWTSHEDPRGTQCKV